ncbi:MAG: hypothetical protein ACREYF_11235, partial [Gammaproteobacteria bacterium]
LARLLSRGLRPQLDQEVGYAEYAERPFEIVAEDTERQLCRCTDQAPHRSPARVIVPPRLSRP